MDENNYVLVKSTFSQQTNAFLFRAYNTSDPDKVEMWIKVSEPVSKFAKGKEGQTFKIVDSEKDDKDKVTVKRVEFGGGSAKAEQHVERSQDTSQKGERESRIERLALLKVAAMLYGRGEFEGSTFSEVVDIVDDIFEKKPVEEKVK